MKIISEGLKERTMNIAVILGEEIQVGGGFQYALSTMLVLNRHRSEKYNFIFFTTSAANLVVLEDYGIQAHHLRLSGFDKLISQVKSHPTVSRVLTKLRLPTQTRFDRILARHGIDLVYPVSPSTMPLLTERFNYLFMLMDLCHRDFMEFPEVRRAREFEIRENLCRKALPKAVSVITESELGRANAIRRYGLDAERVVVLPMLPSEAVIVSPATYESGYFDVKRKYGIDGDYVYYPAQFWPHKNHLYILDGLKVLREKYGKRIHAVFSGSDKGNLQYVLTSAKKMGLEKDVHYIGFVAGAELPYLYRQALALVMPTYFGPTNIPPLEAFYLECPVLYSDLPGLRDQVAGAALLVDLTNPASMAENIMRIIAEPDEMKILVANGRKKVESWQEEDYWLVLKRIFDDYAVKRKCWE